MENNSPDKGVLAIDFGTSNTYLSKCPADQSTPIGIDFGRGRDGIASAILFRDDKEPIIGDIALEEFGDATDNERSAYRIRSQFKPDIADSKQARGYARDFLACLIRDSEQQNIALQVQSRQVIFGVPSEAGKVWRDTLKAVAKEAGYGSVQVVDEPKGALYFHVQRKDITPLEATEGALVVDFGGGTCDFALVVHGDVKHSWGDMHLGGRLFDDVFFQWLIDQNPNALEDMRDERAEFFVLWFLCREVKEKFSQAMALDRTGTFRKRVDAYGRLSDVSWDGFIARIRNYRPSATFLDYMRRINPQAVEKISVSEGIDIPHWFRESLRDGLQHPDASGHPIACIILTGGSSSWPFVAEIVTEEMAAIGHQPRLVRSDKPYATIAEGLAIIPSLQRHFAQVKKRLRQEVPSFLKDQVEPLIRRRMDEVAKRIADSIAVPLFDQRIGPTLIEFREQGGSVASLKTRIAAQAGLFEDQIEAIVEQQVGRTLKALPADVDGLLDRWFKQHQLVYRRSSSALQGGSTNGAIRLDSIDVYGDIESIIGLATVGIIAGLVATISGGAGTALIASGPVGLFLGAAIGLVAGVMVVAYGLDEAKSKAEHWEGCPLWVLQKALSDNKIAKVREDLIKQIQNKVIEQVGEAKEQLEQQIRGYVDEEIESLSAINQV